MCTQAHESKNRSPCKAGFSRHQEGGKVEGLGGTCAWLSQGEVQDSCGLKPLTWRQWEEWICWHSGWSGWDSQLRQRSTSGLEQHGFNLLPFLFFPSSLSPFPFLPAPPIFWLSHVACGILSSLTRESNPGPLHWRYEILTTGLPGKSQNCLNNK